MSRVIVHLDADAFYASVEQAADTRLRGKPVAVGGEKRGIIASASYEAGKFGVFTPMPTVRARKLCPKLIVLPGDFDKYEQFSRTMFSYAYDFTPDVEQTSIDEGYYDLSANRKGPPVEIALTIRKAIGQSLKISVSEGIASNKLVSQIASKLNKPAAFTEIAPGRGIPFLHPLPSIWLPGIGPKTASRLNAAGLAQIRHVRLQQQRSGEGQNAEANVRDISDPVEINTQQHVAARGDRAFRCVPQNPRRQTGHLKAEASQHVAQKQVLLEAIAAAAGAHQLLLKRRRVKTYRPLQQWIQVLKRNRLWMPDVNGAQRVERRPALARVADTPEIAVKINHRCHCPLTLSIRHPVGKQHETASASPRTATPNRGQIRSGRLFVPGSEDQ